MGRLWVSGMAAALLLVACGENETRIEQPSIDVYAMLSSLPADANALPLTKSFPGSDFYLDPQPDKLVWHFTHQGIEYGRMIAKVTPDGAKATDVTAYFEDVHDNPAVERFHFLRVVARIAAEASVQAALEKRPVDIAAVQAGIDKVYASDPVANQMKMIGTISKRMDEMAPPDIEESNDPVDRRNRELLQETHGCGSDNGVPNPC